MKKFFSYFLAIILSLSLLLLTFSMIVKQNLNESSLIKYLKDNDISFVLKNTSNSEISFINQLENSLSKLGIPESTLDDVLNSDATKEFLGKYLMDILEYLIYQKDYNSITGEDIKALVINNFDSIDNSLASIGLNLTPETKQVILNYADKYSDTVALYFPTPAKVFSKLDQKSVTIYDKISLHTITTLLRVMTSNTWLFGLIILSTLAILILLFINRKKSFTYYKVSGFIYVGISIIIEIIANTILKEKVLAHIENANSLINYLMNTFSQYYWLYILGMIIITLIFSLLSRDKNPNKDLLNLVSEDQK